MKTVYKYIWPLPEVKTKFEMPLGAEILHVDEQLVVGGDPRLCLWVRVDPNADLEERSFTICGTGMDCPITDRYVGTAVMAQGLLVLHVFEGNGKVYH